MALAKFDTNLTFNPDTDTYIYPENGGPPTSFRRKVVKKVKQPFTVPKKVLVTTKKVVPCEIETRVPGTRLVAEPDFEEVDEPYFETEKYVEKVPVKKFEKEVVSEPFTEKVPITKTRTVRKPVTRIKEIEDFQIVKVPGSKVIEIEGWRIDEVEDKKVMEIEEWATYEWHPHPTAHRIRGALRDLGVDKENVIRREGAQVYLNEDLGKTGIDWNAIPADGDQKDPIQGIDRPIWGVPAQNTYSGSATAEDIRIIGINGARKVEGVKSTPSSAGGASSPPAKAAQPSQGRLAGRREPEREPAPAPSPSQAKAPTPTGAGQKKARGKGRRGARNEDDAASV